LTETTRSPHSTDSAALISLTSDLVRIPSVLGGEGPVAERVGAEMRLLEYDEVEIDAAGNAVGVVQGAADGPTILFDAHMDTVDVYPRDDWSHDPFGGATTDGRIYGRGSSDMKGALAAMIHAVGALDRSTLAGRAVVSASVGEELIEGAALGVVMQRHGADFVVVGEASELDIVRAGRGRAEWILVTKGLPSHASTPEQGVNAVHSMRAVIEQVEALPMASDPFVGNGVMCLTDIISVPHPAHSVVPSGCRATYERRLIPGDTEQLLDEQLRGACVRAGVDEVEISLAKTDYTTYTGVRWEIPKWFAPWEIAETHELVQQALQAVRAIGQTPGLRSYQFCTNAAYSAGNAGVPTIGYGPSGEAQAHVVDEYLEVEQLLAACRGYRAIAQSMLRLH
jgi:putative selenium metabolism hydrolase